MCWFLVHVQPVTTYKVHAKGSSSLLKKTNKKNHPQQTTNKACCCRCCIMETCQFPRWCLKSLNLITHSTIYRGQDRVDKPTFNKKNKCATLTMDICPLITLLPSCTFQSSWQEYICIYVSILEEFRASLCFDDDKLRHLQGHQRLVVVEFRRLCWILVLEALDRSRCANRKAGVR